jgi:transposase
MTKFIRIGVDLAKNYFQLHARSSEDGQPRTRKLSRQAMRKFYCEIDPCLVGMEACASARHWARELIAMGHDVRLIPPIYVKPDVKRGPRTMRPAPRRSAQAMARRGHALLAGQERREPSGADAAQDARAAHQAAHE